MKNLMKYYIVVFVAATTACCTQPKGAEAKPLEAKTETVAASEAAAPAEKMSQFAELTNQSEYIFSSESKTSTEKLKAIFADQGLIRAKALGGEQYFLKFGSVKTEQELLLILGKNGLKGSVSKNQRLHAPPPGGGGKKLLKDKLEK